MGKSISKGISKSSNNGSIIKVVPLLLTKNPAIPNHRKVVLSDGAKASAPKGFVFGGLAWYFFSVLFVFAVSAPDCACTLVAIKKRSDVMSAKCFMVMIV